MPGQQDVGPPRNRRRQGTFTAACVSVFVVFCFVFVFSGGIDRLMASPSWADSAVVQAGKYTWITYKEAYDTVIKVGASIRSLGVGKVRNSCLFMLAL